MNASRRFASLVVLALVISIAGAAHADVNAFWKQLGASATGGGVSNTPMGNTSNSPAVAINNSGNPIVVYVEHDALAGPDGRILVRRWTGTAFENLSGPSGIGNGADPQIKLGPNGALYVAWLQNDGGRNQVHLLRRAAAGSTWDALGISDSPGGLTALNQSQVAAFSLAIGLDNNPIVAFDTLAQTGTVEATEGILQDESQVYVKRFNSVSGLWEYVGSDPFTGGGASNAFSGLVNLSGTPTYARHAAFSPSLAVQDDGGLMVAFQYSTAYNGTPAPAFIPGNTEIFATQFATNASMWTAVGPSVPVVGEDTTAAQGGAGGLSANGASSFPPSLAIRSDQVWVAWVEGSSVYTRSFDGANWVELAGSGSGPGISSPTSDPGDPTVVIDTTFRPVVTWTEAGAVPSQTFVKRGLGAFVEMGDNSASNQGISDAAVSAFGATIAAPPFGNFGPAAVWLNTDPITGTNQVFLRQFSTTAGFTMTVNVIGASNESTVFSSPIGVACPGDCTALFPSGQAVQLFASAGDGQRLLSFTGCNSVTGLGGTICNVSMTANKTITVTFGNTSTLSVTNLGTGANVGRVTAPATGGAPAIPGVPGNLAINCAGSNSSTCSAAFNANTLVTLSVVLPVGTKFGGWDGDCLFRGTNTTCGLNMSINRAVAATFTQNVYDLTLNPTTTAGPAAIGSRIDGVNPDFDCFVGSGPCITPVDHGTKIDLVATPGIGHRLMTISSTPGSLCKANGSCAFTITGNSTINAGFRAVTQLSINRIFANQLSNVSSNYVLYSGNGLAGSSIDCGGGVTTRTDCSGLAFSNSSVTMTAFVAAGSILDPNGGNGCTWTGTPSTTVNTTRTCTFNPIGVNQSINISYTQVQRLLTVTGQAGTTQGFAISRNVPGIDCGNFDPHFDCSELYDHGQVVDLEPFPGVDSRFDRFVSGCSSILTNTNDSTRSICRVNMTRDNILVTKNFVNARLLSLNASGNGGGAINTNLTPTFKYTHPGLAVSRLVSTNNSVTLTPAPAVGSNFVWDDGLCTGKGPCTFKMGQNQSRVGLFRLNIHSVIASRVGGNGSVVSTNDIGADVIDCGTSTTDCSTEQNFGTNINLLATPDVGFRFTRWTGTSPCSLGVQATNSSCFFQIKGNVTTIANYRAATAVTLFKVGNAPNPNGQGTLTASGTLGTGPTGATAASMVTCGLNCANTSFFAFDGNLGRAVTFRATPSIGSNFLGFTGDCTSGADPKTCSYVPGGANDSVTGTFVLQQFNLSVTNRLNGTVTSVTPAGAITCGYGNNDCLETLNFGTTVNLQAVANPDVVFTSWTGDAVCAGKTNSTCIFNMPNRHVLVTPNYRQRTAISLFKAGNAPSPAGQGTIVVTGTLGTGPTGATAASMVTCGLNCGNTSFFAFDGNLGRAVTFKATTSVGSNFLGFTGDCTSGADPKTCSYVPSGANDSVTGTFVLQQFNLSVTNRLNGTVTSTTPAGVINCGNGNNDCLETLNFGTSVSLLATQNPDAVFTSWTGDAVCAGKTSPTCTFNMPNRHVTVTPNYRQRTAIALFKAGNAPDPRGQGTIVVTGTLGTGPTGATAASMVTCGLTCGNTSFFAFDGNLGKVVTFKATTSVGSNFLGFTGDCTSGADPKTCSYVPSGANDSVTGTFVLQQFNLSVTNRLNGTVTSVTPAGAINCGNGNNDCLETLNFGTLTTLVAAPNDGVDFTSWTGDPVCAGKNTETCTFNMPNRHVTVTPNYRLRTFVGLTKTGGGQGTVTATSAGGSASLIPSSVSCGTTCTSTTFQALDGRQITLSATPSTGSDVVGFTGDCVSNTSSCSFFPTGNTQNVSTIFVLEPRTVNVTVTGDGMVTSGLFGCDASTDPCGFTGDFGTTISFALTPGLGNKVLTRTGCNAGGNTSTCSVTLNQAAGTNKSVVITFSFLMSVSKFGDGTGTVTSSPAGVNCGADCSETYAPGTPVTLNRAAGAGSNLGFWGDDCAFRGLNASCTLPMTSNRIVSAGFQRPVLLSLGKAGSGNGSVTSSPAGINCGAACLSANASFVFGTTVTLTSVAGNGSVATGFLGCDASSNTSCTVSMTSNRSVTASFDLAAGNLSAQATFPAGAVAMAGDPVVTSVHPQSVALRAAGALEDGFLRQVAVAVKRFWDWIWAVPGGGHGVDRA